MSEHTPTPWHRSGDGIVQTHHVTRDVWAIPHCEGDLDFIVLACNSHDRLVLLLERALIHIPADRCTCAFGEVCSACQLKDEARAALAAAKENA